jgi:hypothetical protein
VSPPRSLKSFLRLHGDILPREVVDDLIPVSPELVGNRRKKDHYRHGGRRSSSAAILPHLNDAEHSRYARMSASVQRVLRWLSVDGDVILRLAGGGLRPSLIRWRRKAMSSAHEKTWRASKGRRCLRVTLGLCQAPRQGSATSIPRSMHRVQGSQSVARKSA